MTCKDCLHYGLCLCDVHISETSGVQMQDSNIVEKECEQFKDKSRFIELPCKVGDTVYAVLDTEWDIGEYVIYAIHTNTTGTNIAILFLSECHSHEVGDMAFYAELIGKDIYLTREEAEKALKERESNA